jgi:hypothetical protein
MSFWTKHCKQRAIPWQRGLAGCAALIVCAAVHASSDLHAREPNGGQPNGGQPNDGERLLIIAVDAIPFEVVAKLTGPEAGDERIFEGYQPPTAIINTFPSSSYVAWAGLLEPFGIAKSAGYEARHFDRSIGKAVGGFTLSETSAPWKEFFDWRLEGVLTGAVAYGWPKYYSLKEVEWGLDAFLRSRQNVFTMYVVSTDGVGHRYGHEGLAEFMKNLDKMLVDFKRDHPELEMRTILFSDHGMAGGPELINTWPAVQQAVESGGFHVSEELENDTDVAIISFGLLSSFEAYTQPANAETVARLAASVPGIDLCVVPRDDGVLIVSTLGDATIRRRLEAGETLWSYQPINGDPLHYVPLVADLRQRAGATDTSWFPDSWWFEATKHHQFPDALHRLMRAFDLMANPASLACSVSPGHMFGARLTEYVAALTIGGLRWTHGALHRAASLGFILSDVPGWPTTDTMRFDRALAFLTRLVPPRGPKVTETIAAHAVITQTPEKPRAHGNDSPISRSKELNQCAQSDPCFVSGFSSLVPHN